MLATVGNTVQYFAATAMERGGNEWFMLRFSGAATDGGPGRVSCLWRNVTLVVALTTFSSRGEGCLAIEAPRSLNAL